MFRSTADVDKPSKHFASHAVCRVEAGRPSLRPLRGPNPRACDRCPVRMLRLYLTPHIRAALPDPSRTAELHARRCQAHVCEHTHGEPDHRRRCRPHRADRALQWLRDGLRNASPPPAQPRLDCGEEPVGSNDLRSRATRLRPIPDESKERQASEDQFYSHPLDDFRARRSIEANAQQTCQSQ